ncbi:peptidase domain-containing ABC transporter [Dyadobacter sp. 676]|uniref:Peptidase domain-containing ABC transporter n=1 Tax=Dyadobacter sp. 676 TaxID=3088362 RepID=A0AAU8FUG7_9BACT
MRNFPHYFQLDQMDCGPTCLRIVAKYYGRHYSAQTIRDKTDIGKTGVSMMSLADTAEQIGFRTAGVRLNLFQLIEQAQLPCILHWEQNHYVVLYKINGDWPWLGRDLLRNIRGGRKSGVSHATDARRHEQHPHLPNTNTRRQYRFFISDPAMGLVSYSSEEFEQKWLSARSATGRDGISLLLEPDENFPTLSGETPHGTNTARLISYLGKYRKLIAQLVLTMFIGSFLSILLPLLAQAVVDIGIGTQDLSFVNLVLVAQAILLTSITSVDFLRSWILLHISSRINLTILSDFLAKLMKLPISFFDTKMFGDIMQRIGDHQRIESFLTGQAISSALSMANLAIFGALLAYYQIQVFTLTALFSVAYCLWVIFFFRRRRSIDMKRFEIQSQNQSEVIQLIQGMQDIKLARAERVKRWAWERTQAQLFHWGVRSLSVAQFQQAGALFINNSKNILVTYLTVSSVIDGTLTVGQMVSVQYIMGQFNAPIEQLVSFLQGWQDARMSMERLNEVQHLSDEEPHDAELRRVWGSRFDICFDGLTFSYPGQDSDPVLNNIDLKIPHGKITALVGASGSGKTTLLKLLLKFYQPKSGSIRLCPPAQDTNKEDAPGEGLSFAAISHSEWRGQCGVVMQDGFIFSDTIARNIAVGEQRINPQKLYQAAYTANIHDFIEALPLGYQTKIGAEGNPLSQGQKQRILIARAVYKDPRIILFDEATNALDATNEATIVRNLNKFFESRTVVIVAHRLSTVRHADQIVVIERGKIQEIGKHDELIKKRGKYHALVSAQLDLPNN